MLAVALLLLAGGVQEPAQFARCRFDRPVRTLATMARLPGGARDSLNRFAGRNGVAEAGARWESSDAPLDRTLPRVRFVRAYDFGSTIVVWVERGGIVHSFGTVAFRPARSGGYAPVPGSWLTGNLCRATIAILDDVRGS